MLETIDPYYLNSGWKRKFKFKTLCILNFELFSVVRVPTSPSEIDYIVQTSNYSMQLCFSVYSVTYFIYIIFYKTVTYNRENI